MCGLLVRLSDYHDVLLTIVFNSVLTSEIEVFFKANKIVNVTTIETRAVVKSLIVPSGSNNLNIFEMPQPPAMAITVLTT